MVSFVSSTLYLVLVECWLVREENEYECGCQVSARWSSSLDVWDLHPAGLLNGIVNQLTGA